MSSRLRRNRRPHERLHHTREANSRPRPRLRLIRGGLDDRSNVFTRKLSALEAYAAILALDRNNRRKVDDVFNFSRAVDRKKHYFDVHSSNPFLNNSDRLTRSSLIISRPKPPEVHSPHIGRAVNPRRDSGIKLKLYTAQLNTICQKRTERKEIMHALGHAGRGGQKKPRVTAESKVRC